ncbi:MAG: LysR family transcriptional regulator [Paracoccaceae bacterium]
MDWSLVQSFLAVAETGSLSAAARALKATQPTIGRHIQTLEQDLGVTLFRRQARGMGLSPEGEALLDPARAMQDAANALSLSAAGEASELNGTVRITASLFVAHYILPPIIAELRQSAPEIDIDVVATDTSENLLFREADIAVRMYRPEQLDMVTLHLGDVELGLFGSVAYLKDVTLTNTLEDVLSTCAVVGYDRNEEIIRGFRSAGFPVTRDFFPTRCDNQTVYWELVRAGCGLGFGQRKVALADPELREVEMGIDIPTLEVWLTAHEALRHTPRVDAVWRVLAPRLARYCDRPNPSLAPPTA